MNGKHRPLRIAQVSPLYESVPPTNYGGTERVVSYLTEELVRQGHEVTLFASGDSETKATLVPCCERSLRQDDTSRDQLAPHVLMLDRVFARANEFDMIHCHVDYLHFPLCRRSAAKHVTTLHSRLDIPDWEALYQEFSDMPLVSISKAQEKPFPWANWQGTVYHGLPQNLYTFRQRPQGYLAFLGRVSQEKRVDRAIDIARRVGMDLKIAAKVDNTDQSYFQEKIKPMLKENGSLVEFVGEIGGADKDKFLGEALALLFPIDWPEPFGLVMIEAMACGTPTIAYPCGAVPEILEDGVTGFLVDDQESGAAAVRRIHTLSRTKCREVFEKRYTSARMAQDYVEIYQRLLKAC